MTVRKAAEKWGISDRRVRTLCSDGEISGVICEGRRWMILTIVEYTYNSNAIEGNTLTFRETDMVLRGLMIG